MNDYLLVEKEKITEISFPNLDVISELKDRSLRTQKIHRATSLGNIENYKVHIIFQDQESVKKVYTTIWAHTQENIVLKKGIIIPVNRIVDIQF